MADVHKTENCVFHGDKLRFDKVVKEIQRAGIIPRPYIYRVHMTVCSCKKSSK